MALAAFEFHAEAVDIKSRLLLERQSFDVGMKGVLSQRFEDDVCADV